MASNPFQSVLGVASPSGVPSAGIPNLPNITSTNNPRSGADLNSAGSTYAQTFGDINVGGFSFKTIALIGGIALLALVLLRK